MSLKNKFMDRYFEVVDENVDGDEQPQTRTSVMTEEKTEEQFVVLEEPGAQQEIAVVLRPTVVSKGTEIQGNLDAKNDIEVRGKVVGNVITEGHLLVDGGEIIGNVNARSIVISESRILGNVTSESSIDMDARSTIDGDIKGENVSIDGKCKGDIYADGLLHMMINSQSTGDLFVGKLQIDEGAKVDGRINMCKKKKIK